MGDETRDPPAQDDRSPSEAGPSTQPTLKESSAAQRPDYRLKSVAEQIGGEPIQIDEGLELLVPSAELHLATPQLKKEGDVVCACHSVCTCVPVSSCACDAVCRCDTVASAASPRVTPATPPRPAETPRSRPGGGCAVVSHYWRPN